MLEKEHQSISFAHKWSPGQGDLAPYILEGSKVSYLELLELLELLLELLLQLLLELLLELLLLLLLFSLPRTW